MTVADLTPSISYLENGVTLNFAVPFRFDPAGGLVPKRIAADGTVTQLAYGTQWTAIGGDTDAGGTLTLAASTAGATLVIDRRTPRAQNVHYDTGDRFPATSHEAALDRLMQIAQEHDVAQDKLANRALLVPDGEVAPPLLPPKAQRAGFAAWDGNGGLYGAPMPSTLPGANVTILATSRAAMASLAGPVAGQTVFLAEGRRSGYFEVKAGNAPAGDALQGLYVQSAAGAFHYARRWDGVRGKPEWFGALPADGAADNVAALRACHALCPVMVLEPTDYWTAGPVRFDTPYRRVSGAIYSDGYNTGNGTRFISKDGTRDVVQQGYAAAPGGGPSFYLRNNVIEGICAMWSVPITQPAIGSEKDAPAGFNITYTFNSKTVDCSVWEPLIGFKYYGVVYHRFDDCKAFRSSAPGGANDFFRGFFPIGNPPVLAGGNASVYHYRCTVEMGGSPLLRTPTGFELNGDFADLYYHYCETSQVPYAVRINGTGSVNTYGQLDVEFVGCKFDQCGGAAVGAANGVAFDIQTLNAGAMVTISGGYIQCKAVAFAGIWARGGAGAVVIGDGLQLLGTDGGTTIGVYANGQPNLTIGDIAIKDFPRPVVGDNSSNNVKLTASIHNPNVGNGTQPAVAVSGCLRWHIAPSIDGKANGFAQGLHLIGTANDKMTIDPTRFTPGAISGGANFKVLHNGATQLTTPGYYTTAGAAGTAGDGLCLTGITK